MNIINVNINFGTKKTEVTNLVPLTVGDYNSTKIVFEFDREDGTKVFEMSNPKKELIFLSEITGNELILGGKTETDEPASIFVTPGEYIFEVSLYTTDGKLTSAIGKINVEAEGVQIEQNLVDHYFPLIHDIDHLKEVEALVTDLPIITDCTSLFANNHRLDNIENILKICKDVTDTSNMFYDSMSIKSLNLNNLNTSKVTNMSSMFYGCKYLSNIDLSNFKTSMVTNMTYMFKNCWNLTRITGLSNWDTSEVTSMYGMFDYIRVASLDISNWNVSKVTNMGSMFSSSNNIKILDLSNWDTSEVTNMSYMFSSNDNLADLKLFRNTSKVTKMDNMFRSCQKILNFDTVICNWDVSKVTNMSCMFELCKSIQSLDLSNWNTSEVTNVSSMFNRCTNLQSLDLSNWNTSKINSMDNMFYECTSLTNLKIKINTRCNLSNCPLSEETVNWILNNINDGVGTKTLTLGSTNLAKASAEALEHAKTKGWTVN